MRRQLAQACALLCLLAATPSTRAWAAAAPEPLPTGTDVDYQLGGVATPPAHVGIVVRDRRAAVAPGRYNVCYVNGFQTQPHEKGFWRTRPALVLRDGSGRPVADDAWGEWLLDLSTASRRERLATIVTRWTAGCARAGFDAVEFDNLDSFTRSRGLLTRAQALRYARLLVRGAHRHGLAAAQKNLAGFDGGTLGYDFAVAEECARYTECGAYVDDFGAEVLMVEYRPGDFRQACAEYGASHSVVLRDRALSPKGVHRWC